MGEHADRLSFNAVAFPGFVLLIISMVILCLMPSLAGFKISSALYGITYGMHLTCFQTIIVLRSPKDLIGEANGTFYTGMDAGFFIGSLAGGFLSKVFGYSTMYLLMLVPLLIGFALYMPTGLSRTGKRTEEVSAH